MVRSTDTCLGWTLLFITLGLTGCATMSPQEREPQVAAGPTAQCTLDLRPSGKSPQVSSVEIPPDATVQSVLEKTKAHRKFSRSKIDLYRQLDNGAWHKMTVDFDSGSKKVDSMHDYHVRPGDRLMVTEDTSDIWDDMMKSKGGPIGSFLAR